MDGVASPSLILSADASTATLNTEEDPRRPAAMKMLRQALQAVTLTIRTKKDSDEAKAATYDPNDLGSLLDFLRPEMLGGCGESPSMATLSTCTPGTLSKAQLSEIELPAVPEARAQAAPFVPSAPPPPSYLDACGHRRRVPQTGKRLTVNRAGCPRSLQLRGMLPSLPPQPTMEATPAAPSSARSTPRLPATPRSGGRLGTMGPASEEGSRGRPQPPAPHSNFTPGFLAGIAAKPSQERHPLLLAMEEQEDLDVTTRRTGFETAALLSNRLGDRVWDDPRRGFWSTPAEWSRVPSTGPEDSVQPPKVAPKTRSRAKKAGGSASTRRPPQSIADRRHIEDMHQLLRVMDPEGVGSVQPELLVALLFWQGLARHRTAALAALERAFGPGDILISSLTHLAEYAEVQVKMVEGLRKLAQRESLEHLCEFFAEGDMMRPRRWFGSMKRDPTGQTDIAQILRWLAQMEIISGRQDLFRFLSNVDLNEAPAGRPGALDAGGSDYRKRNFRFEDFVSLLCRCVITWCLHTTIEMLNPPGGSVDTAATLEGPGDPLGPGAPPPTAAGAASATIAVGERRTDVEMGKRWAELERHIGVSFFVNQRFWGKEARQAVMSVRPLRAATIGQELTEAQWMSLYQRVRAQGMAAILPEGEDAEDPHFLANLVSRSEASATPKRDTVMGRV